MERGTEISAVFHKEIVLSENVVSPNKEQGELSFDPGGPMKFVSNSLNLIEGGDKEKIEPQLVAFAPNLTQDKEALCSVDGSLIITASHMPYTGNGFKLFANSGGIYGATYTAAAEASLADLSTSQNVRKVTNDGMLGVANAPSPIYMASVGGEQLWRTIAPAPRLISGVGAVIKDGGISKGLELKEEAQLYRKSNTQFRNVKEGPMGLDKHFYPCFGGLIFDPGGSGSVYVASSSISTHLKLKLAHYFGVDSIIWDFGSHLMNQVEPVLGLKENMDAVSNLKVIVLAMMKGCDGMTSFDPGVQLILYALIEISAVLGRCLMLTYRHSIIAMEEIYYSNHCRPFGYQLASLKLLSNSNEVQTSTDTGSTEHQQLGSTPEGLIHDTSFPFRYHPLLGVLGLLENPQDVAECVDSLTFDAGGGSLMSEALWLPIVIAPHLLANLKGDWEYIEDPCTAERLLHPCRSCVS